MKLRVLTILAALLATSACSSVPHQAPGRMIAPILTSADAIDTSSFARPQEARVTHVSLDLVLDFAAREARGTATLDITARAGAQEIVLDSDDLRIAKVTDAKGADLPFVVGSKVEGKGEPITIRIGAARQVIVHYTANPNADALQWLTPEQTAGKVHPYLFSQGQDILNRSWIPTQDSPGIRQTWDARIVAPKPLNVVMSAIRQGEPQDIGNGWRAFRFIMDKPVAPYLIAIAAGDIDFAAIGPRTGVWAEPATLSKARWEVDDNEKMVVAAEKLYGSYRWGRYDVIVLPPSFPYGGMENPTMTFLTPTFIAGDRSLTGLIAHELAHSWSGNLVTNAVWGDGWLNEGVTSYFENRIVEEVYGTKQAQQEAALDYAAILDTLKEVGDKAPGTALHQPSGSESAGSAIIYNKGAAFLRTLEHEVGRARFDAWLRQWFDRHAFQPATSAMIYNDMRKNLAGSDAQAARLKLREWIFEPGLPANIAKPDPAAFATVDAASAAYGATRALLTAGDWRGLSSAERQRFLQRLPEVLPPAELARLDSALGLSATGNNEELFLWLKLALNNRFEPAVPRADRFLTEVGRGKFVRPLFAALMKQGTWGEPIARRIYAKTRPLYHAATRSGVDRIVPPAKL